MQFIYNFLSLDFYVSILSGHKKFHALLTAVLLNLFAAILFSYSLVSTIFPLVQNSEQKITTVIQEIYPKNLTITIKNGTASTNVTEPYYITVENSTLDHLFGGKDSTESVGKTRILAIDTKGKVENFESYQSMALLTETTLAYYKDGDIKLYSLRDVKNTTITQNSILQTVKNLNKTYHLQTLIIIGVFLLPLVMFVYFLCYILFFYVLYSLAVLVMAKIHGVRFSFKHVVPFVSAVSLPFMIAGYVIQSLPVFKTTLAAANSILDIIILSVCYVAVIRFKNHHEKNSE